MNVPPNPKHPLSRLVDRADAKDAARAEAKRIHEKNLRDRKMRAQRRAREEATAVVDYRNRLEQLRPTVQPPQLRKAASRAPT